MNSQSVEVILTVFSVYQHGLYVLLVLIQHTFVLLCTKQNSPNPICTLVNGSCNFNNGHDLLRLHSQ